MLPTELLGKDFGVYLKATTELVSKIQHTEVHSTEAAQRSHLAKRYSNNEKGADLILEVLHHITI